MIACMIGQIEERVDLSDGHALSGLSHLHDFVALTHLTFTENTEIEARTTARCQQCCHPGFVHPDAYAKACDARLSNLKQCGANLISVTDAYIVIGQSFDREVLAKLAVDEVSPFQLLLPIAIRFNLTHEDSSVFPSVPGEVALTVSREIQPAGATPT